ncbi:Eco57I restriction-modification methylase domain-containing protein [Bacteroides acidifaciens]|uniref:Eco57I restriction-modification methylase domain-containing protein n=2 Tax=Bacteroidales TaxID=171549 RepID=UPI0025839848|nr:N-6 DNA methylase [Bacteroides acidifaciens]
MELKHKLEKIFNNDYPGTDRFIADVIVPIFGNEIEYINDDLAGRENYAEKAKNAGIRHIKYIGDLTEKNYNADNIALLDVTLDDSKNIERSRVNIQQLIRSIMDYRQHLMIVFHYEDVTNKQWRFSYAYKGDSLKDTTSAKRYTYVFGRGYRGRTAAERFQILADSPRNNENFEEAFSVAALSDEFFDKYRAYYAAFVEYITGERYSDERELNNQLSKFNWLQKDSNNQFTAVFESKAKEARDYIKKMFGRIVFLYFLQRKGWLYDNNGVGDSQYMKHLFEKAERDGIAETFLDDVLELLFFYVLNTKKEQRVETALADNKDIKILPGWAHIDYLNGGLFNPDEIDPKKCTFPAIYFKELFSFLDGYNFTIDENDQEDAEIGIDPEMLGRIFENLLEDNKDKGAFYTPKEIVEYMCRESLIAYLQVNPKHYTQDKARNFIETLDIDILNEEERKEIERRLISVKICDPAIGSGAFPMGIVNLLAKTFIVLRTYSSIDQAKMKRYIMQNSIYGVDIEQGAVDIARLRFWLAMVVEEEKALPLPNLHFKVMQGNSLVESYKGRDLSKICLSTGSSGIGGFDFSGYQELLRNDIRKFYETDTHEERDKTLNEIKNLVITQIFEETQDQNLLKDIKDVSANEKFFLWHTWFADVFEKGGFDIVIGNPPYLKEGRANKAIFEAVKDSPYYIGKMDIWYMFACLGLDMLKPDGNLCFIATNNWVTSSGAKKLRQKINTDAQIIQLCDFKDYMIFKTASIQTMIMQFKKNKAEQSYKFDLRNLLGSKLEDVIKLLNKEEASTTQFIEPTYNRLEMRNKFITFSNSEDLFKKIKSAFGIIYLENKEIAQGIVFPQDFLNKKGQKILGHHKVGDGIFGLTDQELSNLNLPENEMVLIKPYYTTEQVRRYFTISGANTQWLIYTDSTYRNESSMDSFPILKAHLDQFRQIFTSDNKPYGLHRARDSRFFSGTKIICQRKCSELPIFSYSDGECYLTQTFNIIKTNRVNLMYLTGLLNSKLIAFWLRNRGKMQGLNYQLDKEPLQQIPIAVPRAETQVQLGHIVEDIINRKSADENVSIQGLESQIDNIVYHLYNLTYDEVLIVDPDTPIGRDEYDNFNLYRI